MIKRFLSLLLILLVIGSVWTWQSYQQALTFVVVDVPGRSLEISKGDSFSLITKKLQQQQINIQPFWFKVIAYQKKMTHKLKAGEYELKQGMTMPELLTLFESGKSRQYSITFPEGWTFKRMLRALAENSNLQHTLQGVDVETIMTELNAKQHHPEGLFFPETYFFEKNSLDFSILKRAYQRMQLILQQEWQEKQQDLPLLNPYQALILASIVEKETAVASERPIIAGVFVRRLQKGMLLQTDPTVIYGMGENYQGNIRRRDLMASTPYNTYVIKGLPPTPIAMPGRESIHAVLHPAPGDSLFFVARGDGSHVFSSTLREHINAVNRYQKNR